MNELRKQLLSEVENGEAYSERTVNRMIDLIVASLPEPLVQTKEETDEDWFYGQGNNHALNLVRDVLESAKGSEE